jgi:hypothetical protein
VKLLEPFLWITGLVLLSTVLTHWTRVWRGRSVPSFADYVDFVGLMGVMIVITIAVGIFCARNWRQRHDPLVGAFCLLILFPSRWCSC